MKRVMKSDFKPTLFLSATASFAVNGFLKSHAVRLSKSFNLVIISCSQKQTFDPSLQTVATIVDIPIARQPAPLQDFLLLIRLVFLILRFRPVGILTITPKIGLVFAVAGWLTGVRVRIHIFTGQVWQNYKGIKREIYKRMDRLLVRLITFPLADSLSQIHFLEAERVVQNGMVTVLANGSVCGINPEKFAPDLQLRKKMRQTSSVDDDAIIVLFLGRIVADKGIADAVDAIAGVNLPAAPVHFWCAGPNEQGLVTEIEERAASYGLRFKYFGVVPEPRDYFCAADLLILPSKREGFGSVIIEAGACGVPTLAYRTYGVSDAIADGNTGFLADYGSVSDLQRKAEYLLADKARLRELGKAAQLRAHTLFSETRSLDYLEKVLHSLIRQ